MHKVIVIGGGPAGMMAAYISSSNGNAVTLIEKNEKLGKKLYITGKGRCNLTNRISEQNFLNNVVTNGKFLYGAINSFSPNDTVSFFEERGLKLKTERGNRVFPLSDKSSDVIKTLSRALENENVTILLNTTVKNLIIENGKTVGVETEKEKLYSDSVIICTGGLSYSQTGSTGDGYNFSKNCGHTVVSLKPSLVGIELYGNDFKEMQGLSLKNVSVRFYRKDKILYEDFGEMLFTHFGVSGPVILSASSHMREMERGRYKISIDLKPALSEEQLDTRILRDFSENINRNFINALNSLLPKKLVPVIVKLSKIPMAAKVNQITKEQRRNLAVLLKNFTVTITDYRPVEEAIVTSGGVDTKQINPKTMQSKLTEGLYFAGEVIDVDAYTGGFNLQIAFSTGRLAAQSVAAALEKGEAL
ncbi:MAG: NAD(P)/FAD-dependent oxidoreductase [Clostridia bacterium]|nr:NAD(P)/FAD-dependent oxidoreductase [Clostridia bacterium]